MSNNYKIHHTPKKLHLFEGYGIELEYMIVDKETLSIKPYAEYILKYFNNGHITNEFFLDKIGISNEIVSHVIELKSNGPVEEIKGLDTEFHNTIIKINAILKEYNAILMPTAMHPFMDPEKEFYLWQYDNQEIYNAYHSIFNCRGHGWNNLQSVHINLPFYNNQEFVELHNAIRLILPLIPALCASSPMYEKRIHYLDSRLYFYENNQRRIPSITGKVIPEKVNSIEEYYKKILYPMYKDIQKYDTNNILQEEWLNSRGAIARFERNAIEIRLMDIQECPLMDITLILFIIELIQSVFHKNKDIALDILYNIYKESILNGTATLLPEEYLKLWDLKHSMNAKEFIKTLIDEKIIIFPDLYFPYLKIIIEKGNLSERIVHAFYNSSKGIDEKIHQIYSKLIKCLEENVPFI